jgi:hypothetical protein
MKTEVLLPCAMFDQDAGSESYDRASVGGGWFVQKGRREVGRGEGDVFIQHRATAICMPPELEDRLTDFIVGPALSVLHRDIHWWLIGSLRPLVDCPISFFPFVPRARPMSNVEDSWFNLFTNKPATVSSGTGGVKARCGRYGMNEFIPFLVSASLHRDGDILSTDARYYI